MASLRVSLVVNGVGTNLSYLEKKSDVHTRLGSTGGSGPPDTESDMESDTETESDTEESDTDTESALVRAP